MNKKERCEGDLHRAQGRQKAETQPPVRENSEGEFDPPRSIRIKDLPVQDRPRERLVRLGPDALSNAELLAILLRTGTAGKSALETAQELLRRFPTLDALARADWRQISQIRGIGRDKAVTIAAALTLARRMAEEIVPAGQPLNSPEAVARLMREEMRTYQVEHFEVLLLNTRYRLIGREPIARGTLDSVLIKPREVFRPAILANAAAVILVHNHPSGDPTPSEDDIRITRDLIRAGKLLQIEVLDHVILGRPLEGQARDYVSLRELGHFYD